MKYNVDKLNEIAKQSIKLSETDISGIIKDIFQNIATCADQKHYSYTNLSEITGISTSHLYSILQGRKDNISLKNFITLVIVLDMFPEDYFPSEIMKKEEKGDYGEKFEYLIRNLSDEKIQFILKFVQSYVQLEENNSVTEMADRESKIKSFFND